MKLEISDFEKRYEIGLEKVTQLCGQNIPQKTYVLESLRRYFGGYRYSEIKNRWRDNVYINGENIGRKYFSILSISSKRDLVTYINLTKQSLMMEYMRNIRFDLNVQRSIDNIREQVDYIYEKLNIQVRELGELMFNYDASDIWDIVQKSNVSGIEDESLEELRNYELMNIFLNLLKKVLEVNPRKILLLVENADHLLTKEEYHIIYRKIQEIGFRYELTSIITLSLDGYAVMDKENLNSVTVFGDVDFVFPEYEHVRKFFEDNYPYNREFNDYEIIQGLTNIVQKIGKKNYLTGFIENIFCKMINATLSLKETMQDKIVSAEYAYLND